MSVIKDVAAKAAGALVKRVSSVNAEGEEVMRLAPRSGVKGLGYVAAALMLWHFIARPMLAYFFPDIDFPALDLGLLGGLLLGV